MDKCGVYQIRNIINNQIYIGSSKNIQKRWKQHIKALCENKHDNIFLQNDWNNYGEDYFEFTILEFCEEDKQYKLEQEYFKKLMPFHRLGNGYNVNEDANGMNKSGYKFYDDERVVGKRLKAIGSKTNMIVPEEDYENKTKDELFEEYDGIETLAYLYDDLLMCNPDWDQKGEFVESKYGVKILNIEAKSLYECNLGISFQYEFSKAMFTNSLLLNYLKDNGLKIDKGWTKDIICIKFNYDSRSYEKELEHWQYLIDNKHSKSNTDTIYSENSKAYKFFQEKLENTKNKKDLFNAKTKEEIREFSC